MLFHHTEEEEKIFTTLINMDVPDYMASLIAWMWINKRERYLEIIKEHAELENTEPVDLTKLDYEKLFNLKLQHQEN